MSRTRFSWNSPVVVFIVVFCVVLTTVTLLTRATILKTRNRAGSAAQSAFAQSAFADWRDIASVGHTSGVSTAPVTITVFADYQCPGCAELHRQLRVAHDSFPGLLRLVKRHYPLSAHDHAKTAANAAECAAEQGRFREFEDALYVGQDSIGVRTWVSFAIEAGVRDTTDFERCVRKRRHSAAVERDARVAKERNFKGTPTYLLNGAQYFGTLPDKEFLEQLRKAVQEAAASGAERAEIDEVKVDAMSVQPDVVNGMPARRWLQPFEHTRTIAGPPNDELLLPSSLVETHDGQLVLFDFGSMELRAFDLNGVPTWRAGRKGAGPGEFRNAMDVAVRSNGELSVLDMSNRRITTLSTTGRVLRTMPVKVPAHRFVPFSDSSFFALAVDDTSKLWSSVNLLGDTIRSLRIPLTLRADNSLEREVFTASFGRGVVVVHRWCDRFVVLRADGSVERVVGGVEQVDFPGIKSYPLNFGKFTGASHRISPDATPAALSVTTRRNEVFILFGGATADRSRVVDVYDGNTGVYRGSHRLPFPVHVLIALADGRFAALRTDPVPSLDFFAISRGPVSPAKGGE